MALVNTRFPGILNRNLWRLAGARGTSTFPLAGIINEAVRRMPAGQAYVNVGTWHG
jgi:hypothetical protein